MSSRIFAAVLAAGRASRFGSTKQLADLDGTRDAICLEALPEIERLWSEGDVRSMMANAGFDAIRITHARGPGMPDLLVICGAKR